MTIPDQLGTSTEAVNGNGVPTAMRSGRAPLEQTPVELVPRLNEFSGYTKAHFQKVVLLPPFSADPLQDPQAVDAPLDLEDVSEGDSGIEVAVEGVILTHEQTWRRKGIALGHLLHSLTLAPGEATRIAMQDWTHTLRGTADELTQQQDTSAAAETRTRALQEVTNGTAIESQHGLSEATAVAQSVQAGLSLLGFSMGASASTSIATTATSSSASRAVGTRENQYVHQATEQNAEAARTRRATVVREVIETEQAHASTRVVANYNHMHALTVLYFEVVEVYDVETRISGRRPCVFIPMALKSGEWLLERYPTIMAAAAESVGMTSLAATIRTLPTRLPLREEPLSVAPLLAPVGAGIGTATSELDAVSSALNTVAATVPNLQGTAFAIAAQPALAANLNQVIMPQVQALREQVRLASEGATRALAASTAARDAAATVPSAAASAQARALLAAVIENLTQATTALAGLAADTVTLSRTGRHPTPRIDPPPPEMPPTAGEFDQMSALATALLRGEQQARARLGTARDRIADLTVALTPAPSAPTDDPDLNAKVAQRIDEYGEYFNQALWSKVLTPRVVHLLLRDRMFCGELLNDVLDPTPVAIIGNTVGFATTSGEFLSGEEYHPRIDETATTSEMALPTGGVFAEAVLGQAVAAERIDLTRFWNWQDSPIPLLPTEIRPVDLAHASGSIDLSVGRLDPSSAPQPDGQPLPAPTGVGDLVGALRDGSMFRDMSGIEAAREVALKAMEAASSGSKDAASNARQSFKDFAELVENVAPMMMTGGASTLLGGLANNADGAGSED